MDTAATLDLLTATEQEIAALAAAMDEHAYTRQVLDWTRRQLQQRIQTIRWNAYVQQRTREAS